MRAYGMHTVRFAVVVCRPGSPTASAAAVIRSVARVQPCCGSRRRGAEGGGALRTQGVENANWRPSEVEVATRRIATCGASKRVRAPSEGGGSTR
eukprot:6031043-Prymnesium_polylepis.2